MPADLVQRARQGDMDAFLELFEAARPTVHAVALRLVGIDEAEDVVMETYLKAWKSIPGFSGRSSPRTWLCRIAHNCAVDWLRRRRNVSLPAQDRDEPEEAGDMSMLADPAQRRPSELVAGRELQSAIDTALGRLTPDHRVALMLRFSDGLSYSEIAAATGVSIGTVMSRLFNGRRKMMKALGELGINGAGGW
jgi:RNA polymerase sigma-70 factor (ECF subfamily)